MCFKVPALKLLIVSKKFTLKHIRTIYINFLLEKKIKKLNMFNVFLFLSYGYAYFPWVDVHRKQ